MVELPQCYCWPLVLLVAATVCKILFVIVCYCWSLLMIFDFDYCWSLVLFVIVVTVGRWYCLRLLFLLLLVLLLSLLYLFVC